MRYGEANFNWKGGVSMAYTGYRLILRHGHPRANKTGYVYEQILVAETAIGHSLPPGAEVHHFNEIRHDNSPGNLVICQDHKYHLMLHARQRVKKLGGDPNTQAICSCCGLAKYFTDFQKSSDRLNGIQTYCKSCCSVKHAARQAVKRRKSGR